MKTLLREMDWLRRVAKQREWWKSIGDEILDTDGKHIGYMQNAAAAEYVSRLHNAIIPLTNLIVQLRAKIADRAQMTREQENDE